MKGISVHMTDQCNQSCKFCVANSFKERKEGSNMKYIIKFLEENKDKGYEVVNIHGGESTILDNFIDTLEVIRDLGYPEVSLQTNASTLCDKEFVKKLIDLNVKTFVTSFHTKDHKEMADLADVDIQWLDKIIQGIKNIKDLGGKVRTNTVMYKNNLDEFEDLIKFIVEELKVDHVNISMMHPTGRAYKFFDDVCPKVTDVISKAKEAVDYVVAKDTIVTLEGFHPCFLEEYTKYIVDWETTDYKLLYHNHIIENYADFMSSSARIPGESCKNCEYNGSKLCGGIYKEYIEKYGWEEFDNVYIPILIKE